MLGRFLFTLILILNVLLVFSQEKKWKMAIEYSPNYSNLKDDLIKGQYKLSQYVAFRLSNNSSLKITPTVALAFINTGEHREQDRGGLFGVEFVNTNYNYNYLFVPLGSQIYLGAWYLLPEAGVALNLTNKIRQTVELTNGDIFREKIKEELPTGKFNKLSFPVSFSLGSDFKLAKHKFSAGVKAYFGLNRIAVGVPRSAHYYGFGCGISTIL